MEELRQKAAPEFVPASANVSVRDIVDFNVWSPTAGVSFSEPVSKFQRQKTASLRSLRLRALIFADLVAVFTSVLVAYWISTSVRSQAGLPDMESLASSRFNLVYMVTFGSLVLCSLSWSWGHYTRFRPFWTEMFEIVKALFYLTAISLTYLFAIKMQFSRLWVITSLLFLVFNVPVLRYLSRIALHRFGVWLKPTCIVGVGDNAVRTSRALTSDRWMGHRVIGFVDLEGEVPSGSILNGLRVFSQIPTVDNAGIVTEKPCIVFALDSSSQMHNYRHEINKYIVASSYATVSPPIHGLPLYGAEIVSVYRHDSVIVKLQNNINRQSSRFLKRTFDLIVSSVLLVMLSPLLAVLSLLICRDGGSVVYGHKRVGLNAKPFLCLKFRSMVLNADDALQRHFLENPAAKQEWEFNHKLKNDPRVTKLGQFLRRTSLDELPQLWNVIKGEMSLVGPRPIVFDECEKYGENLPYYLSMLPGITGLWQSSGRSDTAYSERVALDVWYARNWSLWHDFVIILRTPISLLMSKGAY